MQQLGWSIRYFLHLFRQSYVLVWLLLVQVFMSVGTSQGSEILEIYALEGTGFQLAVFAVGLFISGFLYCFGAYWLFFFSNLRGRQYETSDEYPDLSSKLKAGAYQDFLNANRLRYLQIYTRLLLFGPLLSILIFAIKQPDIQWKLWLVILPVFVLNMVVIYGTQHSRSAIVRIARSLFRRLSLILERGYGVFSKLIGDLFRIRYPKPMLHDTEAHPIGSEVKIHSISFARPQHRGFFYAAILGAIFLEIILFCAPSSWISSLGALAVLQLGFCVWVVALVWLGYLDKVYAFPIKFSLFCWIMYASWQNPDHPIRLYPVEEKAPVNASNAGKTAASHFNSWLQSRPNFKRFPHSDSISINGITYSPSKPYPILIICAEGGANRSAYWTAQMLAALRNKIGPDFDEHLFAISSVSGGSVGALTYSAARHRLSPEKSEEAVRQFFTYDFLTGLTNRLIVGEPGHWLSTRYNPSFDRAASFEKDLDRALHSAVFAKTWGTERTPTFREALQPVSPKVLYQPLHLINCTEAETGKCFVLTPLDLSNDPFFRSQLIAPKLTTPIRLSTAMHLSARFPVFSPAAAITDPNGVTRHYVDGGYYDNVGYETARKLLKAIKKSPYGICIRPVIYTLVNQYEDDESLIETPEMAKNTKPTRSRNYWDGIHFLNEPMEILTAASKIRSANTDQHYDDLVEEVRAHYKGLKTTYGIRFDLKSTAKLVPMNWLLSERSKGVIDGKVKRAIELLDANKIDLGLSGVERNSTGKKREVHPDTIQNQLVKRVVLSQATQTQNTSVQKLSVSKNRKRKRNEAPPGHYWSVSQKKWVPKAGAKYPLRPSKRNLKK